MTWLICLLVACMPQEGNDLAMDIDDKANVISVTVDGTSNSYTFNVGIASPDKGCEQYADWWEVIDLDGNLIYRRILLHSHVNEQPFVRSGGPISIDENQVVWIRAHMNELGYGGKVFKGSVSIGFEETSIVQEFANNLETAAPLPKNCAF